MRIHKEGRRFLIITGIFLIILNYVSLIYFPIWLAWLLLLGSIFLLGFFIQFFRNPRRNMLISEKTVVSPADGKVVVIEKVIETEYFKDERIQISVFMSPLNVHINRVPIDGTLKYYKYHPGKYLVAFHPKSSLLNERNTAVIQTADGTEILLRQIAGAVARRIKFYPVEGESVKQGEELGFIKFGSRMDIFLPLDAKVEVKMNQLVTGGMNVIALLS